MKISKHGLDFEARGRRIEDLERILEQPSDAEIRPCAGCDVLCGCPRRSTHCPCACGPGCGQAPRALSSDPERYPIEPQVLPLVYNLALLHLVPPCWSCEGHQPRGGPPRIPQVWFYAASATYPALIAEHLNSLHDQRQRLSVCWIVSLCRHQEDQESTTFVIHPVLDDSRKMHLGCLQADLSIIAESLVDGVREVARHWLRRLEQDQRAL